MAELAIVSADSHLIEPADQWTSRLPLALGQRAPRGVGRDLHGRQSRAVIARAFAGVPQAEVNRMVFDNALQLYRIG